MSLRPTNTETVPFEPLYQQAMLRFGALPYSPEWVDGFSASKFAVMIGAHRTHVQEWTTTRVMPIWWADVAAIRLGLHPLLIWGDWWIFTMAIHDLKRPRDCDCKPMPKRRRDAPGPHHQWLCRWWEAEAIKVFEDEDPAESQEVA